jgi:hypothetical protein
MVQHTELLTDYIRLRQALRQLASALMKQFPKGLLAECAEQLGLSVTTRGRQRPVLVFDDAYEMSVLIDYGLYHARPDGQSVIERVLAESPPAVDSDEATLFQAMREVRYGLFAIEELEPGVGVQLRDLLRDESVFLVDIEFSRTASPGLVLAGNIVSPAGVTMTTGAMLPVDDGLLDDLVAQLRQRFGATTAAQFRELPPDEHAALATLVIRACLASGAAARVVAKDVKVAPAHHPRNLPCSCGSGKKNRRCCGRAGRTPLAPGRSAPPATNRSKNPDRNRAK